MAGSSSDGNDDGIMALATPPARSLDTPEQKPTRQPKYQTQPPSKALEINEASSPTYPDDSCGSPISFADTFRRRIYFSVGDAVIAVIAFVFAITGFVLPWAVCEVPDVTVSLSKMTRPTSFVEHEAKTAIAGLVFCFLAAALLAARAATGWMWSGKKLKAFLFWSLMVLSVLSMASFLAAVVCAERVANYAPLCEGKLGAGGVLALLAGSLIVMGSVVGAIEFLCFVKSNEVPTAGNKGTRSLVPNPIERLSPKASEQNSPM